MEKTEKADGTMNESRTGDTTDGPSRATYQDVLDAPRYKIAEIVDGTLYTQPRPAVPNTVAASRLRARIAPPFDFGDGGPGGWWILHEPELHLGENIVVPDIAGWRRGRMPVPPAEAYFTLAPDWVCEVLSPSTRRLDFGGKLAIYACDGVRRLWLVDPGARSLEAFELRGTKWALTGKLFEDAAVSLPPFEAISFNLGDLWLPHAAHRQPPGTPNVAAPSGVV